MTLPQHTAEHGAPIGNPVVDASGEDVGRASERQGSQVSSVATAPDTESLGIDVRTRVRIVSPAQHVCELARTGGAEAGGGPERGRCASSIIDRQYVALACEVLIHTVHVCTHPSGATRASGDTVRREEDGAGCRWPDAELGGRKSWPWISTPSAEWKVITACGTTSLVAGNVAGIRSGRDRSDCRASDRRSD